MHYTTSDKDEAVNILVWQPLFFVDISQIVFAGARCTSNFFSSTTLFLMHIYRILIAKNLSARILFLTIIAVVLIALCNFMQFVTSTS